MLSRFFIDRPIFAWVIAFIIMLIGIVSITRLPIARYPNIAPPAVSITASYPGASAKTVEDSVTQIIEQNMTALDGLIYIDSTSDSQGNVAIILTFASGTNADTAQVQVQNKLQQAVPLLPQIVQQQGIVVSKSNSAFLLAIGFVSEDGKMSAGDIGDYIASNVVDPLSRVEGVGTIQLFGAKYAMRTSSTPMRSRRPTSLRRCRRRMPRSRSVNSAMCRRCRDSNSMRPSRRSADCRHLSSFAPLCCAVAAMARRSI